MNRKKVTLNIKQLLIKLGVASKEVELRFKNKQIIVNGEICNDIRKEISVVCYKLEQPITMNMGDFYFNILNDEKSKIACATIKVIKIDELYDSNINNSFTKWLNKNTMCIKYSKKDFIIILIENDNPLWIQ